MLSGSLISLEGNHSPVTGKPEIEALIYCRACPPILLEGGAGERVQGARAAYGTCFAYPDYPRPPVIPDWADYQTFVFYVTSKRELGIK